MLHLWISCCSKIGAIGQPMIEILDFCNERTQNAENQKQSLDDFRMHCYTLMKKSLITGFPVLVDTRSSFRRIFKITVLILSTVGFIFQATSFLDMYFSYPTTVSIEYSAPEIFEAPAVTFCRGYRLNRTRFCGAFPEQCMPHEIKTKGICDKNPICDEKSIFTFHETINFVKSHHSFRNRSKRNIYTHESAASILRGNVKPVYNVQALTRCTSKTYGNYNVNCSSPNNLYAKSLSYVTPQECLSMATLWGRPEEKAQDITKLDYYHFELMIKPDDYYDPTEPKQAFIYVHDPRAFVNAIEDGVSLKAGFKYTIDVNMEEKESLPAPYKSNCTDYIAEWRKNGGHGPTTRNECFDICRIDSMVEERYRACVNKNYPFLNMFEECVGSNTELTMEVREKCSLECKEACYERSYPMTIKTKEENNYCQDSANCGMVLADIKFRHMSVRKFKSEPKFQNVELYSNFGGYMGIWLGISLVSIFDLVELLFDVASYPLRKRKILLEKARLRKSNPNDMHKKGEENINDLEEK